MDLESSFNEISTLQQKRYMQTSLLIASNTSNFECIIKSLMHIKGANEDVKMIFGVEIKNDDRINLQEYSNMIFGVGKSLFEQGKYRCSQVVFQFVLQLITESKIMLALKL